MKRTDKDKIKDKEKVVPEKIQPAQTSKLNAISIVIKIKNWVFISYFVFI